MSSNNQERSDENNTSHNNNNNNDPHTPTPPNPQTPQPQLPTATFPNQNTPNTTRVTINFPMHTGGVTIHNNNNNPQQQQQQQQQQIRIPTFVRTVVARGGGQQPNQPPPPNQQQQQQQPNQPPPPNQPEYHHHHHHHHHYHNPQPEGEVQRRVIPLVPPAVMPVWRNQPVRSTKLIAHEIHTPDPAATNNNNINNLRGSNGGGVEGVGVKELVALGRVQQTQTIRYCEVCFYKVTELQAKFCALCGHQLRSSTSLFSPLEASLLSNFPLSVDQRTTTTTTAASNTTPPRHPLAIPIPLTQQNIIHPNIQIGHIHPQIQFQPMINQPQVIPNHIPPLQTHPPPPQLPQQNHHPLPHVPQVTIEFRQQGGTAMDIRADHIPSSLHLITVPSSSIPNNNNNNLSHLDLPTHNIDDVSGVDHNNHNHQLPPIRNTQTERLLIIIKLRSIECYSVSHSKQLYSINTEPPLIFFENPNNPSRCPSSPLHSTTPRHQRHYHHQAGKEISFYTIERGMIRKFEVGTGKILAEVVLSKPPHSYSFNNEVIIITYHLSEIFVYSLDDLDHLLTISGSPYHLHPSPYTGHSHIYIRKIPQLQIPVRVGEMPPTQIYQFASLSSFVAFFRSHSNVNVDIHPAYYHFLQHHPHPHLPSSSSIINNNNNNDNNDNDNNMLIDGGDDELVDFTPQHRLFKMLVKECYPPLAEFMIKNVTVRMSDNNNNNDDNDNKEKETYIVGFTRSTIECYTFHTDELKMRWKYQIMGNENLPWNFPCYFDCYHDRMIIVLDNEVLVVLSISSGKLIIEPFSILDLIDDLPADISIHQVCISGDAIALFASNGSLIVLTLKMSSLESLCIKQIAQSYGVYYDQLRFFSPMLLSQITKQMKKLGVYNVKMQKHLTFDPQSE